jgi:uncharacterized repeat protein (TIGR02543 family)
MKIKSIIAVLFLVLSAVVFISCGGGSNGSGPYTYTVTYDGNTNTGGVPPEDTTAYKATDTVTVLDQGNLVKDDYTFAGWNTQANGTGVARAVSSTFEMGTANVILYAQWANCGNGIVETGEQCDDDNSVDTDACRNNCTLSYCGDGFVQAGEECDDNNSVNNDACTNDCKLPVCGNGIVQADEECDNGADNGEPGNTCSVSCTVVVP